LGRGGLTAAVQGGQTTVAVLLIGSARKRVGLERREMNGIVRAVGLRQSDVLQTVYEIWILTTFFFDELREYGYSVIEQRLIHIV